MTALSNLYFFSRCVTITTLEHASFQHSICKPISQPMMSTFRSLDTAYVSPYPQRRCPSFSAYPPCEHPFIKSFSPWHILAYLTSRSPSAQTIITFRILSKKRSNLCHPHSFTTNPSPTSHCRCRPRLTLILFHLWLIFNAVA